MWTAFSLVGSMCQVPIFDDYSNLRIIDYNCSRPLFSTDNIDNKPECSNYEPCIPGYKTLSNSGI